MLLKMAHTMVFARIIECFPKWPSERHGSKFGQFVARAIIHPWQFKFLKNITNIGTAMLVWILFGKPNLKNVILL
jgi:hypothetical protein